jgi:hypothetical protein
MFVCRLLSEFLLVLHLFSVFLQYISERLWTDGDGASHEFWDVVTLHELTVEVRIGARQFKRLSTVPVLINMSDKWSGEVPVVATTAKDHPSAVT